MNSDHDVSLFDCGSDVLNLWLKRNALKNQNSGASRTFVICKDNQVVGYYALASGSVERLTTPKSISRNMPDPIPVTVLGRLAINHAYQGQHLGGALLKDAILRTLTISQHIGIRALLVHAISEEAKLFYCQYGFQESSIDSMTLLLSIQQIKTCF